MRLTGLRIYPLKSAAGISVNTWPLDAFGLVGDRRFMLVDSGGHFITQREEASLSLILPRFEGDRVVFARAGLAEQSLAREPSWQEGIEVVVWGECCLARVAPTSVNEWFQAALSRDDVRLAWSRPGEGRPVDPTYAREGDQVAFADGFPFHLTTEASLRDLNSRLDEPVSMDRFRPNLIVDGAVPYEEDDWSRLQVGELPFRVVKPCARCQIPNVVPETGALSKEPMRTLKTYRRSDGKILFGQNLIHDRLGTLRVGDAVEAH
jgi:uncharacterized protein YcbX